jgi:peptide/nickel transport system ATP-binding protein
MTAEPAPKTVLDVEDLVIRFRSRGMTVHAVNDVDIQLAEGETLGLIGESGSGKTATGLALIRLLPQPAGRIEGGTVAFEGRDLLQVGRGEIRAIRGKDIAMVFQDPMTSLNPVLRIDEQIIETIRAHSAVSTQEARAEAIALLGMVGIPLPETRLRAYPHELSGGMRQRVMIAIALALQPKILIADEPTTALDVTIQAQVLALIRSLTARRGTSVILITHDLGVISEMCQRVAVMYGGEVVETATTAALLARPSHPYTVGLFHSLPRANPAAPLIPIEGSPPDMKAAPVGCPFAPRCAWRIPRCLQERPRLTPLAAAASGTHRIACHNPPSEPEIAVGRPLAADAAPAFAADVAAPAAEESRASGPALLQVSDLAVHFPLLRGIIFERPIGMLKAVDGVSFEIMARETLGLVGESGSGKSTIGRAIVRLVQPTSGRIAFDGRDITHLGEADLKSTRRRMQMIFQDPYASLDPRMDVAAIVGEPLRAFGLEGRRQRAAKVGDLLARVGLDPSLANRYPHEFSGGQRQRIGIARALSVAPDLVVADEPVSALDVSIQAQIINLLQRLQETLGLTYLLISHDLAVVERMSHRIAVLYLGRFAEIGPTRSMRRRPLHPYTVALLSATPELSADRAAPTQRITLSGEIPSPLSPPSGCRFRTRCWLNQKLGNPDICAAAEPPLAAAEAGHLVACHFFDRVDGAPEQARVRRG